MNSSITELVSKVRYELLNTSKDVKYLNNLFRYFNAIYGELSSEKALIKNPASELKAKKELGKTSNSAINILFEQVYKSLSENTTIDRNASADFMLLYAIGFEIKFDLGELNELNQAVFYKKLITQYNHDFHSNFTSLDDFMIGKKSRKDFDATDFD